MPWGKGLMFSLIASKSFWGQTAMMLVVLAVVLAILRALISHHHFMAAVTASYGSPDGLRGEGKRDDSSAYSNQSETNHNAPARAMKGPIEKKPCSPPCSKPSKHSHSPASMIRGL